MTSCRPTRSAGSAGSADQISTGSSVVQRDLAWLQAASAEEIDHALERGELDQLMGQR